MCYLLMLLTPPPPQLGADEHLSRCFEDSISKKSFRTEAVAGPDPFVGLHRISAEVTSARLKHQQAAAPEIVVQSPERTKVSLLAQAFQAQSSVADSKSAATIAGDRFAPSIPANSGSATNTAANNDPWAPATAVTSHTAGMVDGDAGAQGFDSEFKVSSYSPSTAAATSHGRSTGVVARGEAIYATVDRSRNKQADALPNNDKSTTDVSRTAHATDESTETATANNELESSTSTLGASYEGGLSSTWEQTLDVNIGDVAVTSSAPLHGTPISPMSCVRFICSSCFHFRLWVWSLSNCFTAL